LRNRATITTAWSIAVSFAAWVWPTRAAAHLVTTGLGPVYDGIGHLLLTPEDLVPVLALALFAGLRGAASGRRALFLLPAAWLAGGLAGLAIGGAPAFPLPALSFLLLGGLVAADLHMPVGVVAGLAVALGLVHGFLNGEALRPGPGALGLVGIMGALFVLVALLSAAIASLERPWTRIAVRVAGSWIAATGMLTLGWAFRGAA
jgi:hydrogenase/urease accessory protein HupE